MTFDPRLVVGDGFSHAEPTSSGSSSTSTSPTSATFNFRVPVVPRSGPARLARTTKQLSLNLSAAHSNAVDAHSQMPLAHHHQQHHAYTHSTDVPTPISPISPMLHDQSPTTPAAVQHQTQPHSLPTSPAYPPQSSSAPEPSPAAHRLKRSYSEAGATTSTSPSSSHYQYYDVSPTTDKQPDSACKWSESFVKTQSVQGVGAFVFKVGVIECAT
jgi:hypothetical protein